ncbi:SusD/RagB family nutrient-binding outer membrane lipoprotein, partial [Macellibacteroides fermentans]|uniref:SusD/RagB family nutrient-binding outer membrane lipoprotein n=1 Tax=Macellibacteroides fermentans TaxID=879969 RepID=UPI002CAD9B91|nr:SusD/RagB family nutrient-binding outer membrane lipoprotein [Macellibacteroides fermentans]
MKKYKFAKGLFAAVLLATSMISCSEDVMDGINVDRNHATDVQAKFIVTDLITSTAFSSVGGDISLYTSIYMEHEAGIHNQMFNAETRNGEPYLASTFNNVWGSTYTNLKNALTVIKKCSEDGTEPKNFVTLGVGQIMAAYNLAILTDGFGDVPWIEACNLNEFMQPKIDKQELIYGDIIKLLDSAIANLAKSDATPMGSNDILYGGNAAKWKKAAYGLKARYTMRTLAKAADKNAALNNVLDYVSKSFASAAEEMKFNYYDGSSNFNPYFAFGWSRDALGASKSLADL